MNEETKTYRLSWHGPVSDKEFDVDAFNEDELQAHAGGVAEWR